MRSIDASHAKGKLMDLHGPVQPLPQFRVLYGNQLAKAFPLPAVVSPFRQPVGDAVPHVTTAPVSSYAGRLVQCLKPPNEREQLELLALHVRFAILNGQHPMPIRWSENKPPCVRASAASHLERQLIPWHLGFDCRVRLESAFGGWDTTVGCWAAVQELLGSHGGKDRGGPAQGRASRAQIILGFYRGRKYPNFTYLQN